ncbi:MAG: IS91 family transposase [Acidobacteria bacterium]|nr:IS91 family transposase [Acidobacteriota bacterium]
MMLAVGTEIRYRITDILAANWEAFFQAEKRWIRPVVLETVRKLLVCRTPALGCHVYACPQGHELRIVPHSCKSRFCPTCGKQATDRWADGALSDLLEVPYHHVVLSAPCQLRGIMGLNREACLSILVRAATACFNQWAREQHGMRMGMVSVIHTFGSDLRWHPHLHLLVTEGGLSLDGERWIRPYQLGWLMAHAGLKKMWKYHVVRAFREAHRSGALRFPAAAAFLKHYPRFSSFLSKLWDLTWYAHIGACLLDPSATLRYMGRYTKRAVLAEYRITHYDGRTVRFAFKDYAAGGKTSFKTLPVLAFLGRLVRHIPDKHFKMVRYGGLFATRWKSEHLAYARRALGQQEEPQPPEASDAETGLAASLGSWRERRQAETGIDPLRCSHCGQSMRFRGVAFGSHERIAALFRAAGHPMKPLSPALALGP